jgi:hypothetical protein
MIAEAAPIMRAHRAATCNCRMSCPSPEHVSCAVMGMIGAWLGHGESSAEAATSKTSEASKNWAAVRHLAWWSAVGVADPVAFYSN